MNKSFKRLSILLLLALGGAHLPALASVEAQCEQQGRADGIQDAAELQAYVKECAAAQQGGAAEEATNAGSGDGQQQQ